MPWDNSPEKRRRDQQVYGDPEYLANRKLAMKRSGGKCEDTENGRRCGSRDRVQCDHDTPVSQGGTHHLENLVIRCFRHHARKTAQEGGGYRRNGGRRRGEIDPPASPRTRW
jgi:5-methylcytosine-specific restriction enzyme A